MTDGMHAPVNDVSFDCAPVQLGQMHLTLGLAFQSASADSGNFQKAQVHLHKAKKIWEAHAPKAAVRPRCTFLSQCPVRMLCFISSVI